MLTITDSLHDILEKNNYSFGKASSQTSLSSVNTLYAEILQPATCLKADSTTDAFLAALLNFQRN